MSISETQKGAKDAKPGITHVVIDPIGALETRKTEVNLLDRAIRIKISELEPEHKRRGKDNRSWAASLQVDVATAIERGLIDSFGGQLPQDYDPVAQLRIGADPEQSSVRLEVASRLQGEEPSVWTLAIKSDGSESWSFGKGEGRQRRIKQPSQDAHINMRRIIDLSAHPEKTIESYARVINKWAEAPGWTESDRQLMQNALKLADKYLGNEKRKSGEPYVEHLWETARQMWAWGIRDVSELAAALMHDIPEDAPAFKPHRNETVDGWQRRVLYTLRKELEGSEAHEAAYLTMMMSRPPQGVRAERPTFKFTSNGRRRHKKPMLTREERDQLYDQQVESSQSVRRIKIPDRLHNIRTLWAMPDANIAATYHETRAKYPRFIARIRQEDELLATKMERDLNAALAEYESVAAAQAQLSPSNLLF